MGGDYYYCNIVFRNSAGKLSGGFIIDPPANCRVACRSSMTGDRHPEWKGIHYVESTKGNWVQVTGDGSSYGFVDIGLEVASGYGSIPMYGSW